MFGPLDYLISRISSEINDVGLEHNNNSVSFVFGVKDSYKKKLDDTSKTIQNLHEAFLKTMHDELDFRYEFILRRRFFDELPAAVLSEGDTLLWNDTELINAHEPWAISKKGEEIICEPTWGYIYQDKLWNLDRIKGRWSYVKPAKYVLNNQYRLVFWLTFIVLMGLGYFLPVTFIPWIKNLGALGTILFLGSLAISLFILNIVIASFAVMKLITWIETAWFSIFKMHTIRIVENKMLRATHTSCSLHNNPWQVIPAKIKTFKAYLALYKNHLNKLQDSLNYRASNTADTFDSMIQDKEKYKEYLKKDPNPVVNVAESLCKTDQSIRYLKERINTAYAQADIDILINNGQQACKQFEQKIVAIEEIESELSKWIARKINPINMMGIISGSGAFLPFGEVPESDSAKMSFYFPKLDKLFTEAYLTLKDLLNSMEALAQFYKEEEKRKI